MKSEKNIVIFANNNYSLSMSNCTCITMLSFSSYIFTNSTLKTRSIYNISVNEATTIINGESKPENTTKTSKNNEANRALGAPNGAFASPNRAFASPNRAFASPNGAFAAPNRAFASPNRTLASTNRALAATDRTFAATNRAFASTNGVKISPYIIYNKKIINPEEIPMAKGLIKIINNPTGTINFK